MGRHKKYTTEEQRLAADRADKRRWYQKVKEEKKQVFRLRSLRNYYNNKLKIIIIIIMLALSFVLRTSAKLRAWMRTWVSLGG